MQCPHCGLFNPPEALRCDCGYDFEAGVVLESFLRERKGGAGRPARLASHEFGSAEARRRVRGQADDAPGAGASPVNSRVQDGLLFVASAVVVATLLALPALSFVVMLEAEQSMVQPRSFLGNVADFGIAGGVLSLVCIPLLVAITWFTKDQLPRTARYYLFGLCAIGALPLGMLMFWLFAV